MEEITIREISFLKWRKIRQISRVKKKEFTVEHERLMNELCQEIKRQNTYILLTKPLII